MTEAIHVPDDVKELVRGIFADCNRRVSEKLSRIPNLHETSLDHSFIEHFTHHCRPVETPSEWVMRIDCHFIGGGNHYMRWEVSDFGILVVFRQNGVILRTKVALLQSKRLFTVEDHEVETNPIGHVLGLNYLFMDDDAWAALSAERVFRFDKWSLYRSLEVADGQYVTIKKYEERWNIPVHYLLYNPLTVPWSVSFPIRGVEPVPEVTTAGCRIVPSAVLRNMVAEQHIERPPSYHDICTKLESPFKGGASRGGWTLESYIVDQLISCKDGLVDDSPRQQHLGHIFSQKTRPIHAALVITFDMPTAR